VLYFKGIIDLLPPCQVLVTVYQCLSPPGFQALHDKRASACCDGRTDGGLWMVVVMVVVVLVVVVVEAKFFFKFNLNFAHF